MATLIVGMADLKISTVGDKIMTLGLGSCCGIILYDKIRKFAGMVHVMLPEYNDSMGANKAKYADSGINELLNQLLKAGATRSYLVAKIAGGAHMFGSIKNNDLLKVGSRNVIASKEQLRKLQIPLIAEDTGGKYGRTIEFNPQDGMLKIKIVGHGEHYI